MPQATIAAGESPVDVLVAHKAEWARLSATERLGMLQALIPRFARIAPEWARAGAALEGLPPDEPMSGEEWLTGPALALRFLRHLERSLREIVDEGRVRLPGPPVLVPGGELRVPVFPRDRWDELFFPGLTAEAWLEPGTVPGARPQVDRDGRVCLVLGGGNVTAIPVIDALGKLFVDGQVVLLKLHRLTPFLEPALAEAFAPLIEKGYLRILPGGGSAGRALASDPGVDAIHVTGSDRTYESIVFGDGPQGAERKARDEPVNDKPVGAELGNVSPVIVVPGAWSARDVARQAEHIASMLTNNAGFNCVAARVVITPANWEKRAALLDGIRAVLRATPTRRAWYPGARERFEAVIDGSPNAEHFGAAPDGHLPWTLLPGVDYRRLDQPCFRTEAFCSVFVEAPIAASSLAEYLDRAVGFANEGLWGTLAANLIVDAVTARERGAGAALARAVSDLQFGTIAVNYWSAFGFGNGVSPWGAYPGSTRRDVQSGMGFTHNALMLDGVRKSVIRGPFRPWPKPPYFASHRTLHRVGPELCEFEARPGLLPAVRLGWSAVRG
jgi:aldehyde dehydrogenase (NAD(P)+)